MKLHYVLVVLIPSKDHSTSHKDRICTLKRGEMFVILPSLKAYMESTVPTRWRHAKVSQMDSASFERRYPPVFSTYISTSYQ